MILQPETVEITKYYSALKIMGLDPLTFILALIVLLGVAGAGFYYWWQDHKRTQHIQKTKDSVLLEILPIGGGKVKRILAPTYKGTAKHVTHKSGATFFVTEEAKINESDADGYYLIPGHGWVDEYPYDVPARQRVPILKYYFHENDPFPQMPLEPEKWNKEMVANVTASFARLSREESVAKTMLGQFSGFFENLIKALPALQRIPIMFILEFVIIALLAVDIFFGFQTKQGIDMIIGK